jgi:psp operon transcriptional activator
VTPSTSEPVAERRKKGLVLPTDFQARVQEVEIELLNAGLDKARFNQRVAADLLGLSYHQLRGKIRKYRLDQS